MSRDHSTTAWTPDWLGETPGPVSPPAGGPVPGPATGPATGPTHCPGPGPTHGLAPGPAHAAPDADDDETSELIDLDGSLRFVDEPIPALAEEPTPVFVDEPIPALADDRPLLVTDDDPLPRGSLPGGSLPGGSLPGGSLPGGSLPGGSLPGGDEPIPDQPRAKRARPVVSEGWAEERARPRADRPTDPSVGSLRSLGAVAVTGRRPTRPPSSPRRGRAAATGSARGLVALVLLALLSAFFAWVTAEPLWLAVGHAERGTLTVTTCSGDRCLGTFTSAGFVRDAVPVLGNAPDAGVPTPARMTSDRGANAYVDTDTVSRAALGVALILLCGVGIIRATGVRRLPERQARRAATLLSLAGPLTLLAAMLAVTY